jgi:hypothetical protein
VDLDLSHFEDCMSPLREGFEWLGKQSQMVDGLDFLMAPFVESP